MADNPAWPTSLRMVMKSGCASSIGSKPTFASLGLIRITHAQAPTIERPHDGVHQQHKHPAGAPQQHRAEPGIGYAKRPSRLESPRVEDRYVQSLGRTG